MMSIYTITIPIETAVKLDSMIQAGSGILQVEPMREVGIDLVTELQTSDLPCYTLSRDSEPESRSCESREDTRVSENRCGV